MGTFLGHLVPGLAFAILGIWHTLNTIKSYKLKGASGFRSSTWFPFPSPLPALKHLELYLLLAFSALAIADQLVAGLFLNYPAPQISLQPDALEHSTMYIHLAVYASAALVADVFVSPHGDLVAALAASVFGQELFLLRLHSADHSGLEGHYHWLLQLVVTASLVVSCASVVLPRSFPVAVVRAASVLLQGVWFVVMGFVLWFPAFVPAGCRGMETVEDEGSMAMAMRSAVACDTEEAARRAAAMANLQFSWALAAVWVVTACLCFRVDCRSMEYVQIQTPRADGRAQLAGSDGESPQKRVFPVLEDV